MPRQQSTNDINKVFEVKTSDYPKHLKLVKMAMYYYRCQVQNLMIIIQKVLE
jgi:hypothetical protein